MRLVIPNLLKPLWTLTVGTRSDESDPARVSMCEVEWALGRTAGVGWLTQPLHLASRSGWTSRSRRGAGRCLVPQ